MAHLIVTADDFGLTAGICRGIAQAALAGAVRSVSLMSRADHARETLARYLPELAGLPGVSLGAHLQLTAGTPVLPAADVPSLAGPDGRFPKRPENLQNPAPAEAAAEWRAQIAALRRAGIDPAYLDSHHHIHTRPELEPVFVDLARELALPVRALDPAMAREFRAAGLTCPDACLTGFFGESPSLSSLVSVLDEALSLYGDEGVFELMTHPGFTDDELSAISSYSDARELELAALTAPELPALLGERGIHLVGMGDLKGIMRAGSK